MSRWLHDLPMARALEGRARTHPLDGTDVAGLRPARCRVCELRGGHFPKRAIREGHSTRWVDGDEIPCPNIDWPAVAVVADYLSSCGGWLWVHNFRKPVVT